MGTVYLCSSKTAPQPHAVQTDGCGLSSFTSDDIIIWWDKAPLEDAQNYCLETWCQNNAVSLRQELAELLAKLGQVSIQGTPLQTWLHVEKGPSPWHTSLLFEKHPKMLPMLFTVCKIKALENILTKAAKSYTTINVQVCDKILQQSIREFCQQKSFKYTQNAPVKSKLLMSISSFSWKKLYFFLPHFCQAGLRFSHWLYSMRRLLWKKKNTLHSTVQKHATLVSYFPNIHPVHAEKGDFRSHYWEKLHDILQSSIQNKELHVHHLFIRVNSAQFTLSECIQHKENFQKKALQEHRSEHFYYVEEFLTIKHIIKACYEYFCIRRKAAKALQHMRPHWHWKNGVCSLWPYIQPAWQASFGGWRCLERCLQKQAFTAYAHFLQTHLQVIPHASHQWTLFPWENCPWERMLCHSMRTLFPKSTVFAAQHSCIRQNDFRYFDGKDFLALATHDMHVKHSLPHMYLLNGMHALKNLQSDLKPQKMQLVEALRYDYLTKIHPLSHKQAPIRHIVLITSYFSQEVEAQIQTLAQWWQKNAISSAFKGHVYIKAHPHQCARPFLQKYGLKVQDFHFLQDSMPKIWKKIHFWHENNESSLFWLANSTTVSIEAAHMKVPLCVQQPLEDFNLCPLQGCANLLYVGTAEHVSQALSQAPMVILPHKYFLLKPSLSQWKRLLGIA